MTIGHWLLEALYTVGLVTLIGLSLIVLLKRNMWINMFEAALLLVVCVSAITLFESPPRPGVVGLVVSASLLCGSVYRRWKRHEAERRTAAAAAQQAAEAAQQAALAATLAADAATQTATTKAQEATAVAATAAADAAATAAAEALDASILAAARSARELAAAKATKQYGDDDASNFS